METNNQVPSPNNYQYHGYRKMRWWQWVLIYLLIAAIIYGLGYYFWNLKSYNTSSSQVTNTLSGNVVDNNTNNTNNTINVTISNSGFSPANITIKKGQTVVWTNTDTAPHSVTADKDGPMSPNLKKNESYTDTFITTGTYSYHCSLHPTMKGSVTVIE